MEEQRYLGNLVAARARLAELALRGSRFRHGRSRLTRDPRRHHADLIPLRIQTQPLTLRPTGFRVLPMPWGLARSS